MVFHMPQKQVNISNIKIENIKIEFADGFNFLGLTICKLLKWNSHINKIASKFFNIIGIMYRLKHMVPSEIILPIYNGLIKPHILYGLKCWGFINDICIVLFKICGTEKRMHFSANTWDTFQVWNLFLFLVSCLCVSLHFTKFMFLK